MDEQGLTWGAPAARPGRAQDHGGLSRLLRVTRRGETAPRPTPEAGPAPALAGRGRGRGRNARPAQAPDPRPARVLRRLAPLLVLSLLLSVLVPLLATLDVHVPGRSLLAVLFVTLVPGVPVALALRLPDALVTLALVPAVSFSWALLQGTTTLVTGFWHPVALSWTAAPVALGAALLVLLRDAAVRRRVRALGLPARPARVRAPLPAPLPGLLRGLLRGSRLPALGVLALAGGLWWWGTRVLRAGDAGVLGLLPLLGWQVLVAVLLVTVVAVRALRRVRVDHVVMVGVLVVVALIGFTTVAAADGYGSVPTAWVHVGFVQYVSENGAVPAGVDARFSWPAFWGAGAQLVALAGVPDARGFLVLAPLFSALVNLPALLVIGRVLTGSLRWAWVGVLVQLATNWYQQDYLAPQSVALTCYLAVLATLLWSAGLGGAELGGRWWAPAALWQRARTAVRRAAPVPGGTSPASARGLGIVLVIVAAGIVSVHQLTPLTLVMTLVAFAITGRTRYRSLWLVAGVLFLGWFSYGATDFWRGHLQGVLGDVGEVGNSLGAGVAQRLTGNETYQRAQYVRVAWSGLVLLLAGVGVLRWRRRRGVVLVAALVAVPFALVAVQSYGGEVIIRCFLFAAPVLGPLAATTLRDAGAGASRRGQVYAGARGRHLDRPVGGPVGITRRRHLVAVVGLGVVACLLMVGTRGLNTAFERTSPDLVAASTDYFRLAGPTDAVATTLAGTGLAPRYPVSSPNEVLLDVDACLSDGLTSCLGTDPPEFILLSQEQEAYGELLQGRSKGWLWSFGDQVLASGDYQVVTRADDAWLLRRTA